MEAGELLPSPLTSGFPTIHSTPDPDLISSGDYALLHNGLISILHVSTLEAVLMSKGMSFNITLYILILVKISFRCAFESQYYDNNPPNT